MAAWRMTVRRRRRLAEMIRPLQGGPRIDWSRVRIELCATICPPAYCAPVQGAKPLSQRVPDHDSERVWDWKRRRHVRRTGR